MRRHRYPVGPDKPLIEQQVGRIRISSHIHGRRHWRSLMQYFHIDHMEVNRILVPYPVNTGGVIKLFVPDSLLAKGFMAGFDEGRGAALRITKDYKNRWRRMFVYQRSIMRRDVNIQYPDPFVLKNFMMPWLLADLYHFRGIYRELGHDVAGKKHRGGNKDRKPAHVYFFIKIRINYQFDCVSFLRLFLLSLIHSLQNTS